MIVARHVRVTGRVQGVFFRAWTRDEARRLGVAGWVRNCPDGSVETHLEGAERAVEQLICMLGVGPPQANVDVIKVAEAVAEGFDRFEIRH